MTRHVPADERIQTARLVLVPVAVGDADELAQVFADERLYRFTDGRPGTVESVRTSFALLAANRATDPMAQLNWAVRRLEDMRAMGMLQAAFSDGGRAAEIAWLVGVAWRGQGLASEAARAVVAWLEARGVEQVTAWIHPDHHASEAVATRAGLMVTNEARTTEQHTVRLWRRQARKASG